MTNNMNIVEKADMLKYYGEIFVSEQDCNHAIELAKELQYYFEQKKAEIIRLEGSQFEAKEAKRLAEIERLEKLGIEPTYCEYCRDYHY